MCRERSIGTYTRSLELRGGVVVPLECSVDDLGAHVDHVGHDRLALRAVPRNVSGLSESVSVGGSVILVIDGGLSGSPLSVSVGARWVSGQNLSQVPVEEIWVVDQGLGVQGVVVQHDGARVSETSAETTQHEVHEPSVSQPASYIEVLDGKLSNEEKTQKATYLSASSVVGPVEI